MLQFAGERAGPVRGMASRGAVLDAYVTLTGDPAPVHPKVRGTALGDASVRIPARVETVIRGGGSRRAIVPDRFEGAAGSTLAAVERHGRSAADPALPDRSRPLTGLRTPVLLLATGPDARHWRHLLPSTRLHVVGRLVPAERGDAIVALVIIEARPQVLTAPKAHQRLAGHLRAQLRQACAGLPAGPRGLLPGLVVGDTGGIAPEVIADFRTTELSHLVAVSGTNITILLGAALLAFRYAGVRGRALPLLGTASVVGFVVLARPEPSVLRAAVMGLVTLAALFGGRRRHGPSALAAAALVLLLVDPGLARSYGFILSVLATAALLLLAPRWTDALVRRGWPPKIAVLIALPCAAQAVCAPVVVTFTERVSLVSVACNLAAEFAVAPATVLGFLVLLAAPLALAPAVALAYAAALPLAWIICVARTGADVPGATVAWPGGWFGGLTLAVAIAVAVLLGRRLVRRPLVSVALALVLCVTLVRPQALLRPLTGWPPPGWVLVMCDVGQGDALVLNLGRNSGLVVDTGPDPARIDRCLRELAVDRVPVALLTHFHADHVEGLPGVLDGRAVGMIETSALLEPPGQVARVRRWATAARVPIRVAHYGELRQTPSGTARWRVVGPRDPEAAHRLSGSAPNNASVVVLAEVGGVRVLLTGDLEPDAQRALRTELSGVGVDVLKVPHHGSARQDPALLRGLRPRLAIVSAGTDNPYGHPARSTLETLRSTGAHIMRTDRHGSVAIAGPADRLRVVARGRTRVVAHPHDAVPDGQRPRRQTTPRRRTSRATVARSDPLRAQRFVATSISQHISTRLTRGPTRKANGPITGNNTSEEGRVRTRRGRPAKDASSPGGAETI